MNREVHVRFWERPEVKLLRATRQNRPTGDVRVESGLPQTADIGRRDWQVPSCQEQTSPNTIDAACRPCGLRIARSEFAGTLEEQLHARPERSVSQRHGSDRGP